MEALLLTSHCRLVHSGENLIHSGVKLIHSGEKANSAECALQRNCSGLQCPGWLLWSVQYALCTVQVQCAVFSVQRVLCSERLEQEEATLSPPCLALALPHPIQRGGSNILHATKSHKSHPIQCGGLLY